MKSRKKISPQAPPPHPDVTDTDALVKTFHAELMLAVHKGLGLFFEKGSYSDPKIRQSARVVLEQAANVLPEVINSLLSGLLSREQGFVPIKWTGIAKSKIRTSKREHEKNVEGELTKIFAARSLGPAALISALGRKMLAPLIGGKLSPEERKAVIWRWGGDLAIVLLSEQERWMDALPFIVERALLGEKEFFERLGRALYSDGDRKRILSAAESFLIMNWDKGHEWYPNILPGLKFWRDSTVQELLGVIFYQNGNSELSLTAYRSMRDRLGLKSEKKMKVVRIRELRRDATTGKLHLKLILHKSL